MFAISACAFALVRAPVAELVGKKQSNAWFMIWFAVTASLFLTQNFWLFLIVSGFALVVLGALERDRIITYLLVLNMVPVIKVVVPGFGGIGSFAHIAPQSFFAAILLVPALLIHQNSRANEIPARFPWVFLAAYFALTVVLELRGSNLTSTMRLAFDSFFAIVVPFWAISTCVNSSRQMRQALAAIVFPLLILAFVGVFESLKSWHPYAAAVASWTELGLNFGYLQRSEALRAYGSTGGAIIFGSIFMVGIGLCLGLLGRDSALRTRIALISIISVGLLTPLARGPWLGTGVILVVFLLTGPNPVGGLLKFAAVGAAGIFLSLLTPVGDRVINLLPYIGSEESTVTADYREKLLENSWIVIQRNPFFGSVDYLQTPEMQEMIQGQGIIDIVNTYLQVALNAGLVGLGLFVLFFAAVLIGLARALRALPEADSELKLMARALFATLCGLLATIFTISSVGQIPYLYWILAGLCVAQTRIIRAHVATQHLATPAETTPKQVDPAQPDPIRRPYIPVRRAPGRGRIPHG